MKITESIKEISSDELDGDLDKVIQNLQDLKKFYPNHTNLRLECCGYGDGPDYYTLVGERDETPAEEKKRLKVEQKEQERIKKINLKKEIWERKELVRLTKKYGQS